MQQPVGGDTVGVDSLVVGVDSLVVGVGSLVVGVGSLVVPGVDNLVAAPGVDSLAVGVGLVVDIRQQDSQISKIIAETLLTDITALNTGFQAHYSQANII